MDLWIVDGIIWIVSSIILASDETLTRTLGNAVANTLTSAAAILLVVTTLAFPFISPEPLRTGFKVIAAILVVFMALIIIALIINLFKNRKNKK